MKKNTSPKKQKLQREKRVVSPFVSYFHGHNVTKVKGSKEINRIKNKHKEQVFCLPHISSVIKQKGESQNGCFKKTKHAKFSEKRIFLTP